MSLRRKIAGRLGGPARTRVVVILALVLGLDTADVGVVGSMVAQLRTALGVTTTQIGLLLTVSEGAGAIALVFFGWLADRTSRTRLLAIVVPLWACAMAACGFATSYLFLLVARAVLGGLAAAATPTVASLLGDYFPQRDRAEIYGLVLSGEIFGTGIGFLLAGLLASIWWRLGFFSLAALAPFLGWALARLPEPARGGASELRRGATQIPPPRRDARTDVVVHRYVAEKAREAGVRPRERLLRDIGRDDASLRRVAAYVLRIPTNLALMASSVLGYFFFAGARAFAVALFHGEFALSHALTLLVIGVIGSGAVLGVVAGGWLSDRLIGEGNLRGRVIVGAAAILTCAALLFVGLLVSSLWPSMIAFFLAAAALGGLNPPIDAARLDVVPASMWGRAEAIRMAVRKLGEAAAPLVVAFLAGAFGGGTSGLRDAFYVLLGPLVIGGCIGLVTLKTYLRDAVTADAYRPRHIRTEAAR